MRSAIDVEPRVLSGEICRAIKRSAPNRAQVQSLRRQLLQRHLTLRLKPVVSAEEVVEAYFRCLVTDILAKRFELTKAAVPSCINSSHRAVRRVCGASAPHTHAAIEDLEWRKAWSLIQQRNEEVNVRVDGRRSPKRADLYVVTHQQVVSLEFKYAGHGGLRDVEGCAEQFARHAACHAAAILVLYSGTDSPVPNAVVQRLLQLTAAENVRIVNLCGPAIEVARAAA